MLVGTVLTAPASHGIAVGKGGRYEVRDREKKRKKGKNSKNGQSFLFHVMI